MPFAMQRELVESPGQHYAPLAGKPLGEVGWFVVVWRLDRHKGHISADRLGKGDTGVDHGKAPFGAVRRHQNGGLVETIGWHEQTRHRTSANHGVGGVAKQHPAQLRMALSGHDDEVGLVILRVPGDLDRRKAQTHHARHRNVGAPAVGTAWSRPPPEAEIVELLCEPVPIRHGRNGLHGNFNRPLQHRRRHVDHADPGVNPASDVHGRSLGRSGGLGLVARHDEMPEIHCG